MEKINEQNDVRKLATIARILLCIIFIFLSTLINAQNSKFYQQQDSLNSVIFYNFRQINTQLIENIESRNLASESLLRARNQIYTGMALQILSGGYVVITAQNENIINKKPHFYAAAALSVIGFGFEIRGINSIGTAGVQLKGNELSIRIKF